MSEFVQLLIAGSAFCFGLGAFLAAAFPRHFGHGRDE